jgi:hypothetical protein
MANSLLPFRAAPITDRAFWTQAAERIGQADAGLAQLQDGVDGIALQPPMPLASDYLAAKRSNDRKRLDEHWRITRGHLTQLVARRALSGIDDANADDRLLDWLFALAFEPTWVVSAHLPGQDLPLSGAPQLDLAATEFAMELAETREVLEPWMKAQSGTLARSIVNEIDRRVLTPFGEGAGVWWHDPTGKKPTNNWAGVCGGSILAACQSLAAQGLERPNARARAIDCVNYFLRKAFTQSGECDEGIGYWIYGVEFACHGIMRVPDLAKEIDIDRLRMVASYPARAHLFGKTFFAGNDTGRSAAGGIPSRWLARATGDAFLNWWTLAYPAGPGRMVAQFIRSLAEPVSSEKPAAAPVHPVARQLADQQVAIFQSRIGERLITFTLTGGNNNENHNHNDLGTFQYFVDGRALIPDLGAPHYTTDFFSAQRYTKYLVAASGGHCCPSVNGHEQRAGNDTQARVVEYRDDAESPAYEVDCTAAYPAAAGLKRWTRRSVFDARAGTVQLTDQFTASGQIVHRIWTDDGEPRVNIDGVVETASLHLSISPKPTKITVVPISAGDERLMLREWKPDHVLYCIDATFESAGTLQIETTIRPN